LPAEQAGNTDSASFGDQKWWETFQDETLQQLIRTALQQNYDVRIAAARILQAGAQLGITRADQFPAISAATVNERIPQSLAQPAVDARATQAANNMPPQQDIFAESDALMKRFSRGVTWVFLLGGISHADLTSQFECPAVASLATWAHHEWTDGLQIDRLREFDELAVWTRNSSIG
jgi:hypothetical protein